MPRGVSVHIHVVRHAIWIADLHARNSCWWSGYIHCLFGTGSPGGVRQAQTRRGPGHQASAYRCHAARRSEREPSTSDAPPLQLLSSGEYTLIDEQWARIAPLLPPQKPPTGRPAHDHRTIVAGIFWVIRTGASWRELPTQFGPWQTIHTRYQRWRTTGIWQQILNALDHQDTADGP